MNATAIRECIQAAIASLELWLSVKRPDETGVALLKQGADNPKPPTA